MEEKKPTIGGRPIKGERSWYSDRSTVEQFSAESFLAELDAVFESDERVQAVQWRQYTPYFNDGEACTFSANFDEPAVALGTEEPTALGEYDYDDETDGPVKWVDAYDDEVRTQYEYNHSTRPSTRTVVGKQTPLQMAFDSLSSHVGRGHYDNVLLSNFGDPATVMAVRSGSFSLEFYDHE